MTDATDDKDKPQGSSDELESQQYTSQEVEGDATEASPFPSREAVDGLSPQQQAALAAEDEDLSQIAHDAQRVNDPRARRQDLVESLKNWKPVISGLLDKLPTILTVGLAAAAIFALVASIVFMGLGAKQVIGHNDNVDGCLATSGDSGGGVSVGGNPQDQKQMMNAVGSWLMTNKFAFLGGKPMTKEQAAGVIGNMVQESQVDPGLTQNNWVPRTATNAEVRAAGESSGGRAIGLAQWDSGRKKALLDFADKQGKLWSDVNAQLAYLGEELKGYEGTMVKAKGFDQPGLSVNDYTLRWEQGFERAGIPAMENRYKGAFTFMSIYNGASGDTTTTGGSCLTDQGVAGDTSDAAAFAASIAYQPDELAKSRVGANIDGGDIALPSYKAAKARAQQLGGADPQPRLYASCDRFVATVYKNTLDKNIPWGATDTQYQYFMSHPNLYKAYHSKSEAKAGDIWVTNTNGHIVIYIGNYKGTDSIASASYHHRVSNIQPSNYLNGTLVDTEGRQYTGFHFVGPGGGGAAAASAGAASSGGTEK